MCVTCFSSNSCDKYLSLVHVSMTQDVDLDDASSGCSSLSARTQGSTMSVGAASTGNYRSRTLPRPSSRAAAVGGGGGGVEEEDFSKAFSDTPAVTVSR